MTMIVGAVTRRNFVNLRLCRCISSQIFKTELNLDLIKEFEKYWFKECQQDAFFDREDKSKTKFYVLSMFPYPSGNLHMGHVRVYTLSDVIARFRRMKGMNVFQPIGWDAFGLPAENAAIERGIRPDEWTKSNISHMKKQLKQLCCTFDWQTELATCSPDYYKWTQYLFLKMYDAGLVYQKESLVNWDPIDCTVLADEQVNGEGQSWRSGAKVEKRVLKQWFIRTTNFAQALHDGLNTETLLGWDDIIDVQKNWIGECDGYSFDLRIKIADRISDTNCFNIWVQDPLSIIQAGFVTVKPDSFLDIIGERDANSKLNIEVVEPFTNRCLPVFVSEDSPYPFARDVYVGVPTQSDFDSAFAERIGSTFLVPEVRYTREEICKMARNWCIGGYPVSSNIKDWLISRQRYWGTPIPMVHCSQCGIQPVPYDQLPVALPPLSENLMTKALNDFLKVSDWKNTTCPNCGRVALRDTDTMDTFVDSSWYFLRYTDVNNQNEPFNKDIVNQMLPVDLYVGGKEHAVLHLYYARFFSYFLHSIGMIEHREPFCRLLCQGMVKGRTYKTKAGKYLKPNEIRMEGKTAKSVETGEVLDAVFEKMSKSKYNGIDPEDVLKEYGLDTTRLFLLYSASPKSHREWDEKVFENVMKWEHRLWITITSFINAREDLNVDLPTNFDVNKENDALRKIRNEAVRAVTYHYQITQEISASIAYLQKLSRALRAVSRAVKIHCEEFEKALAALIIMLSPIMPHFAATLWFGFTSAPSLSNQRESSINWNENVFHQKWPQVDVDHEVPLYCRVNQGPSRIVFISSGKLSMLEAEEVLELARKHPFFEKIFNRLHISQLKFQNYDNLCAIRKKLVSVC